MQSATTANLHVELGGKTILSLSLTLKIFSEDQSSRYSNRRPPDRSTQTGILSASSTLNTSSPSRSAS
jgi:hypothetical protein